MLVKETKARQPACSSNGMREIPRIEATHVMVALHATVHDRCISLFPDPFTGHIFVDPIRISPHAGIDLAELYRRASVILNGRFELITKVAVVEKDIRIMKPAIEVTFE